MLGSGAEPVVSYAGTQFSAVTDVECGPDGLYFLDIYGETQVPHHGGGGVYKLVHDPDARPAERAGHGLTGAAHGRYVFNEYRCHACHRLDGAGGGEGPPLINLRKRLDERLNSAPYGQMLRALLSEPGRYFQEQHPRYNRLLELDGDPRIEQWLKYHIHDPRFDNPSAKMPSHDMSAEEIDALTIYLLEQ
jgi:hypothetical protein